VDRCLVCIDKQCLINSCLDNLVFFHYNAASGFVYDSGVCVAWAVALNSEQSLKRFVT